jgi:hypothetical protein
MNGMPLDARGAAPLSGGRDRAPRHRLAEAIDLAVVALLVLGYLVAAPGGFRWEREWLRVSMASPSRAVMLAVVLLIVRRWRAPGAPTHPWIGRPAAWLRARFEPASSVLPRPIPPWTLGEAAAVVALFLALTAVMLHRQVLALHRVPDLGDPLFSIWRLSWVAHQLPADPLRLFDGNMFYPELRTLAYSDAMLATALLAAPFLWLGCPQVVVYNLVLLLSFVASGVAMYALVRRLTGDRWAAVVAGIAFAFYSFRFEHYSHLELQVTFWMPLALLMLHRTVESGRARDAVVTGLLVALQTLSSLYYGLFLLVMMAVVWAVTTFGVRAEPAAPGTGPVRDWRGLTRLWLPAAVIAGLLVLPVVIPYFQNRAQLGDRPPWEARLYSALPGSYLVAPSLSLVYGSWLAAARRPEVSLFPGLAILALATAGAWSRFDAKRAAYVVAAFIVFDGSLGANGIVFPTLRDYLLPFRGLRAPARFSILVGLSLSVLAGYGILRLRQSPRLRGAMASLVPAACAAVLLVENVPNLRLVPVPAAPPTIYDYFRGAPPRVLADLPFPQSLVAATRDARFLYFSTFHWQRLLTGSSGYFPESFRESARVLRRFPTAHGQAFLRRRGVEFVAIDRAMCVDGQYESITAFLDADPTVELVTRITAPGQEGTVYRIMSMHNAK